MAQVHEDYHTYDGGALLPPTSESVGNPSYRTYDGGPQLPPNPATAVVPLQFAGINLDNNLGYNEGYIPPDTMGAVGATQFMETTNGAYAVYNKANGALEQMQSMTSFWQKAGQAGSYGDSRVLFDGASQKWIALSFATNLDTIQIAVSNTADAAGAWKSTSFVGFAGGIADFPTLAIDSKAIYIGTNNFTSGGAYAGETLNVLPYADLLGGGAPTAADVKQFVTPYAGGVERGFAIQGVNGGNGNIIAAANYANDVVRYDINNPGTAGATQGPVKLLGLDNYANSNGLARQPNGGIGSRSLDASDQRIGANAWEQNGKIYAVYTATPVPGAPNADHTEVRWVVTDAATNKVIQQGTIAGGGYDYYQGSIAVNAEGEVVIGYNRSGYQVGSGNVTFFANAYESDAAGVLSLTDTLKLHTSTADNYFIDYGSGRNRWGDYSAVTIDPNNPDSFWAIGEYAYNGPDLGNGSSRWGTWISDVVLQDAAVPEPATWAMMLVGLGAIGGAMRRRAKLATA